MNKKGIELDTVIVLVIALIVIVGVFAYVTIFTGIAKGSANKQAIQVWVRTHALGQKSTAGLVETERPDVPYLDEPLVVEREDLNYEAGKYPRAFKEIGDSMYDCWEAFERGKSDFLKFFAKKTFCYPCRVIKFSDIVKKELPEVKGFYKFMNENKPGFGENAPTYLQFLTNNKDYKMSEEELKKDLIKTDKELYIMFAAASGINIVGTLEGERSKVLEALLPSLPYFATLKRDFASKVVLGDPEEILSLCNPKQPQEEELTEEEIQQILAETKPGAFTPSK